MYNALHQSESSHFTSFKKFAKSPIKRDQFCCVQFSSVLSFSALLNAAAPLAVIPAVIPAGITASGAAA